MSTLYELTGEYLELLNIAQEEDDQEIINDTLEAIGGEIEDKADGYAVVIKELEANSDKLDKEIKRLQERKKTISNNIGRIKFNLENAMKITGKVKFKTLRFSFGIQKNPASVMVKDEKAVPDKFWKPQEPVLDKKGLIAFIKENGNTAYAELTQTESLRIR